MFSTTSMLCAAMLLMGNPCDPIRTLDQTIQTVHEDMAGEHWYQVRFQDVKIGSLSESRSLLPSGNYLVNRSLRFSLIRNRVTQVDERLEFFSDFPYHLSSAVQETTITQDSTTTVSRRTFPIGSLTSTPDSQFTYLTTLTIHPRFIANREQIKTKSIDYARDRLISNSWQVRTVRKDNITFVLESFDGRTIRIVSSSGISTKTSMPGGINLMIVDRPLTEPWHNQSFLLDSTTINVPVDQPIVDPHRLDLLTLRLRPNDEARGFWGTSVDGNDYLRIDRRNPPVVQEEQIAGPKLQMSKQPTDAVTDFIADSNLNPNLSFDTVRRLVDELYTHIAYEDVSHPSSITETLRRKTGDCTEFADVFNAIAARLGWNSRIRSGLAYHPPSQSFRPHSWNEVAIEGRWITVDASWRQVPADATHVPFPRANTLALLAQASSTRFEVVDRRYLTD